MSGSTQAVTLPVCTVGDETCQLPCGACNTRAFIYEASAARLALTRIVHDRNTTVMSFEVRTAGSTALTRDHDVACSSSVFAQSCNLWVISL